MAKLKNLFENKKDSSLPGLCRIGLVRVSRKAYKAIFQETLKDSKETVGRITWKLMDAIARDYFPKKSVAITERSNKEPWLHFSINAIHWKSSGSAMVDILIHLPLYGKQSHVNDFVRTILATTEADDRNIIGIENTGWIIRIPIDEMAGLNFRGTDLPNHDALPCIIRAEELDILLKHKVTQPTNPVEILVTDKFGTSRGTFLITLESYVEISQQLGLSF